MKDKPIVVVITLLGGAVACICSILNNTGLMGTLITVLITLICFLIIGQIANKIFTRIKRETLEREQEERRLREEEEERQRKEEEEAEEARKLLELAEEQQGNDTTEVL